MIFIPEVCRMTDEAILIGVGLQEREVYPPEEVCPQEEVYPQDVVRLPTEEVSHSTEEVFPQIEEVFLVVEVSLQVEEVFPQAAGAYLLHTEGACPQIH